MNTVYIYFIHIIFNTTWSIVFFRFSSKWYYALATLIFNTDFFDNSFDDEI